jgi:putative membrane protein
MKNEPLPSIWEGMAAGLIGGLVASYAMSQFQSLWMRYAGEQNEGGKKKSRKEPTTVKAASAISKRVFDHTLTRAEKKYAGPAVHYAMGATSGAIYGAAAELIPAATAGGGIPFGTAVWLVADDVTLPAVGLSKWPTAYPFSQHAYAFASHVVYGLTTEAVRRALRSIL